MLQSRGNTGGSQPNAEDAEGPEATSENTDWNYAEHVSGKLQFHWDSKNTVKGAKC